MSAQTLYRVFYTLIFIYTLYIYINFNVTFKFRINKIISVSEY